MQDIPMIDSTLTVGVPVVENVLLFHNKLLMTKCTFTYLYHLMFLWLSVDC